MQITKWLLLAALTSALVVTNAERAQAAVLIKNDRGGDVLEYYAKYQALRSRGERVVVDGDCLSACTLVLILPSDQRCFTRRARLGFHAAWDEAGTGTVQNPVGTAIFMSAYPPEILRWINRRGGLTTKVLYLEGKELAAIYPPCRR